MKSKNSFLSLSLLTLFFLNACTPDDVEKNSIIDPNPITPDITVKITSSVAGFVVDENEKPVVYASVTAGNKVGRTDEYGYFKISNASLAEIAGQVKVVKNGYFDGYKTFLPEKNKEAFVRLKLLTKNKVAVIDASTGGVANLPDGGKVEISSNGVVLASNNTVYTGEVHVYAKYIDPSETTGLNQERPGDFRGTDTNGHLRALKSFSTLAVELTTSGGQLLQLKEGKPATITLPISTSLLTDAPTTIDLWRFDTASGLWKQEGTATKTGDMYIGTVTHFSFWEGAEGLSLVNFSAHIVNASAQPLANVPVSITISGMPKNAGHGRFGYTDENGNITGAIFANANLVLDVLTPCALSAYAHEFSTTSTDINLGTITGNLGQNMVTISGTVTNCDNEPVVSGYVQTYDNGFYNRATITNGSFSFTGLACTNTNVHVVVVDTETFEQNTPASVIINPGVNNLGVLQACGTSTMGSITYTLDGISATILEPTDTLAAYAFTGTTSEMSGTQILTLSGNPNEAQKMSFQFTGAYATGTAHKVTDVFSVIFESGRGYWPAPVTVTITEYGDVGGFISGSFSSNMLDFESNNVHSFSCSFRVRRQN